MPSSQPLYSAHPEPDIRLHYLGHASFILQFDNRVSILTDYGTSYAYGLDSPIYDMGDFKPAIVTYSHKDADHYRGQSFDGAQTLTGLDSLSLKGITIKPIRTTERAPEDNTSYLIGYKGFTILHLGDAQGDIASIHQEDVRKRIKKIFPGPVDLLLMTIGWTRDIIREAESFVDLLQPRRIIPMHYWSRQDKLDFLTYLQVQNNTVGKNYHIQKLDGAQYAIFVADANVTPIQVISLEPAPFSHQS